QAFTFLVDVLEIVGALKRTIIIGGLRPGNVLRAGDMTAAQCAFPRIGFHVQQFASVFFDAADIDQRLVTLDVILDLIAEGPELVVSALRSLILRRRVLLNFLSRR